jgi:ribonuclease G
VDFVDMKLAKSRRLLHQFMQQEFGRDKARSNILPISQLGIMQITRQRHKESVLSQLYSHCPYCGGEGVIKSPWNLAMRMQREILTKVFCAKGQTLAFKVLLNPHLKDYIITQCRKDFNALEADFNVKLEFKEDSNLHIENFKIVRA